MKAALEDNHHVRIDGDSSKRLNKNGLQCESAHKRRKDNQRDSRSTKEELDTQQERLKKAY
jgi:hypothetical protein